MKTLFILRHAKSSWADAEISDFERPLNERGLRTAPFMGNLMAEKGFLPSIILSSPAVRARQTSLLVNGAAEFDAQIQFEHRIYDASPHRLCEVVSEIDDSADSAMLVGHNPGIEGFIHYVTGNLEPMPTAALAVIELTINKWNMIGDGCGKLQVIYRPKQEIAKADDLRL